MTGSLMHSAVDGHQQKAIAVPGGAGQAPKPCTAQTTYPPTVVFEVDCSKTKPGEAVFVTGGHEALGTWNPAQARPLATSPGQFPRWTSEALSLPAGCAVDYKFLVQRGDRSGAAMWEPLNGNRTVTAAAGAEVRAATVWGSPQQTTTTNLVPLELASAEKDQSPGATTPEETGVRSAAPEAAPADAEPAGPAASPKAFACRLAEAIEGREPRRKNFSQSLFRSLDDDDTAGGSSDVASAAGAEAPVEGEACKVEAAAEPEEANVKSTLSVPGSRGVPLKHISSFSALTDMLDPEEKAEVRKGREAHTSYEPYNLDVPVVIVTSEIAPYSKTGGLGLVAASYSYEFARKGHRTMAVSPKYRHYDGINWIGEARVVVNGREETVVYWHRFESCGGNAGCDHIFVDHPSIEREGGLYNGNDGREYEDNLFRFTLLSLAAMEAPLVLSIDGRKYGDKVLFLANDWQAGLVPLYLNYKYRCNGCYTQARVIYVVHNLGYQGQYPRVPACHFFGINPKAASDVEIGDCVNLTKGALLCADRVLTVSPNYAKEIQTPQGGFRLESFVRAKSDAQKLAGILNGIDDCWNPEVDTHIFTRYSVDDFEEGKRANKLALQRQLNLREDANCALIGFVGRLTWQKGVDVLGQIVSWLMEDTGNGVNGHVQLIMMGNGERQHADTLRWAEGAYPGRVCGFVGFDPKVEHQMMAGCDLFLMPSRYEPCGLPQMYSQRYGTLPIVTATGGLTDSVVDISAGSDKATGFHMSPLSPDKMREVVYKACELCLKCPEQFRGMQDRAMRKDFYWPQAMDEYERQIDKTLYEAPVVR